MRKLLIILLLISQVGLGQDAKYLSENYEFKDGEVAFMFGDNVKLRDQPNTESSVLSLLKIGEQIEIIGISDTIMEFEGIESPWYKVKANGKIGFVLGGLISLDKATFGNLTYLIALKKDGEKVFLKTRVYDNNGVFKENTSQLSTNEFSIVADGNKGIDNLISIFEIDYLSEACGVNGGGIYLFYDGKVLIKAIDYTHVVEAGLYWFIEDYIFPTDKDGIKGKIVYNCENGENKDEVTEWTETKITSRNLEWNGKEVIPKIEYE